jgi:hypothetical protein
LPFAQFACFFLVISAAITSTFIMRYVVKLAIALEAAF